MKQQKLSAHFILTFSSVEVWKKNESSFLDSDCTGSGEKISKITRDTQQKVCSSLLCVTSDLLKKAQAETVSLLLPTTRIIIWDVFQSHVFLLQSLTEGWVSVHAGLNPAGCSAVTHQPLAFIRPSHTNPSPAWLQGRLQRRLGLLFDFIWLDRWSRTGNVCLHWVFAQPSAGLVALCAESCLAAARRRENFWNVSSPGTKRSSSVLLWAQPTGFVTARGRRTFSEEQKENP